eukprot:2384413-Rhodomonas_salina.1
MEQEAEKVREGDVLSVVARHHEFGKAKYKCVEILKVVPCEDTGRAPGTEKSSITRQKAQPATTLTGRLINLLPACGFMESSPGNSNVYIPLAVIQQHSERLREGDVLS